MKASRHLKPLLFLYLTFGTYFGVLFSKILQRNVEGIHAGHVNVWSDWSLHIGITNLFAHKPFSEWFLYHPFYAGGKFTYPFLTNLIPSLFMRVGVPIETALTCTSFFYSLLLIAGLYFSAFGLIRSTKVAALSVMLFFFSSGPGFFRMLWAWFQKKESFSFFLYPPNDYTRLDSHQWYAGNVVTGLLAPQRGFLLGMALGSCALALFLKGIRILEKSADVNFIDDSGNLISSKKSVPYFFSAALVIGLLPITHVHTLMALSVGIAIICISQIQNFKKIIYFILPSALLVFGFYFTFISGGIENKQFMNFLPGYTALWGMENESLWTKLATWIRLWIAIWGLMIPWFLLSVYFFFKDHRISFSSKAMIAGFVFNFILGNLILFQPVAWDNSKVFFWCYFGFSVVSAWFLNKLWSYYKLESSKLALVASTTVFFLLSITGMHEMLRLIQIEKHQYRMTDSETIELGEKIRSETKTDDVFLTAPDHNHFIMMWANRPILMGFTAWVWNYGFLYYDREKDLKEMFEHPENSNPLFEKYKVSYVVIGQSERVNFKVNEDFFRQNWKIAFRSGQYDIYAKRE